MRLELTKLFKFEVLNFLCLEVVVGAGGLTPPKIWDHQELWQLHLHLHNDAAIAKFIWVGKY
jgi:hypothetical protein